MGFGVVVALDTQSQKSMHLEGLCSSASACRGLLADKAPAWMQVHLLTRFMVDVPLSGGTHFHLSEI